MLPVIEKFMAAHQLPGVTVVADAGMISGGQPEVQPYNYGPPNNEIRISA
jgi:hypothetical protein